MCNVAKSMAEAEHSLGLDSHVVDIMDAKTWDVAEDADIQVVHTHFPDVMRKRVKNLRVVWVSHGTPEHVFEGAVEDGNKGYGHADGLMLMQRWLQVADARVTFWPRHQWIFQRMVNKGTPIHCIPLGVDLEYWSSGTDRGRYAGKPSVWTGENPARIKWPLDLFLMWPEVKDALPEATLHANRVPQDMHRWFFPLINANGTSYAGFISPFAFAHEQLRDIFKSIDFFIGLVRYGDHNRVSMEAAAAGAKTISYTGNVYADYWIPEGDQREGAAELIRILSGEIEPRSAKQPVPSLRDTALGMIDVYRGIL
jgi:hypothetical protein